RKKQEIYEKHLQEIKKQTEIEESKKHIKIRIKEYEIQRNNLIEEKYKLDSDNFNSIIEAVKKIPISHQTFTMPISLISLLNQVQVNLPKNYQDIDRCIEELFKKKEEFEKKIEPNMLRLNKQIQEIDEKIKEEYKVLEGMPPTEVKVYKEKKIVGVLVGSRGRRVLLGSSNSKTYEIVGSSKTYEIVGSSRKKVDSENIKNEEMKAVNNSEISLKEIKTCDRDVVTIFETLPSQPTIYNNNHSPSSNTFQVTSISLLDSALPSSCLDSSASGISEVQKGLRECLETGGLQFFGTIMGNWVGLEIRQEENGERRRITTCLAEPCSLTDTTLYMNLREKFLCKIKELSEKEIGDVANVSDAARIIQAAQVCYDEITRNEKPRSAWKENIESKISKLVLFKDLLEKARKQEKLSTSETKSLKKIMREFNLNLSSVTDISEALKKITMHESRKQFRKENRMFEFFRGRFYRGLSERVESEHVVNRDEIVITYDDYSIPFASDNHSTTFPLLDELKLTNLYKYLYDIVKVICLEGTPQADWFYCGITYLIPKGTPKTGSDYRPITCMSNLYKITTKCVTKVLQIEVERQGLLSGNQLGAVRGHGNNLNAAWIYVKKAYDSMDHAYLTQCIENFKIDKGIRQEDSLSPLLFGLCMDSLSRKLNENYTKVTVQTDAESHSTNYLLFIDDLKLFAKDSSTMSAMTDEAKEFLEVIALVIYKEKSATNDTCCEDTSTLLEGRSVFKYLGIVEDSKGIPTSKSYEEIQNKLIVQLDDAVRAGCKELLYLPRKELGEGLHSVEFKSEHMLLRAAILKVENINKTHLSLIKNFLKIKYGLEEEVTKKKLEEAQLANLYNEIKNRKLHSKLYSARNNELVSVNDSSRWLKNGSVRPRDEADRNVFWGAEGMCQHCNQSRKTVDHLATRCEKMLGHDYTRRHKEVYDVYIYSC
ncbi:reverse transcriptase, partial [Hamiltosporidium tvaerminnensis]